MSVRVQSGHAWLSGAQLNKGSEDDTRKSTYPGAFGPIAETEMTENVTFHPERVGQGMEEWAK